MSAVDFDAHLRRLFAAADTSPDFEARLAARIAALRSLPEEMLRARIERRREAARIRLRREALLNAATAAGVGAAFIALIWREGSSVAHRVEEGLAAASDPGALMGVALVTLALGIWLALQRLSTR